MTTLADLIGVPSDGPLSSDQFLARFGMERNPFPTARTILPQVMYNQQAALQAFAGRVKDIIQPQPAKRSLAVIGGTGGGKSHFQRHCQHLFEEYSANLPRPFFTVEFLAGTNSVTLLLREMLRRADEVCKDRGEYDLLGAIVRQMASADDLGPVRQTDLRSVLARLYRSTQAGFNPPDRDGVVRYDALREIAKKWLAGATLTQTERRYLGVFARLGTASIMTRVTTELFALAHEREILGGGVVCVDEVETLFTGQTSSGKTQAFLQDLRYLFDESVRSDSGYSLMIISASTTTGTTSLSDFNYPLYQRLGFEGDGKVVLEPIKSLAEVKEFARVYIEYEQERASIGGDSENLAGFLIDADYEQAFAAAASATRDVALRTQGSVNQAQLLEALHRVVETKRHLGTN